MSLIPWPTLAAGALAGALLAGGVQQYRVSAVNRQLTTAQQDLAAARIQRDSAVAAAGECSERVGELQRLAAERARAADAARRQAAQATAGHNRRADQILSTPFSTPDDPCASAKDLLQQWLNR